MYLPLLMVVVVVAAPAPDKKKDTDLIQGTWSIVSFERAGETKPDEDIKKVKVVFDGNTIAVKAGEKDEKATFKLDPDNKPKTIDITPEKDKMVAGIYELKGDEAEVVLRPTGPGTADGVQTEDRHGADAHRPEAREEVTG